MSYKQRSNSSRSQASNPALPDPAIQPNSGESDPVPTPTSRRSTLKRVLLAGAGAGLAISGPALAAPQAQANDTTPPPLPPMPQAPVGGQRVIPTSPATPGTSYLLFSGLDFKPLISSTTYSYLNFSGVYATASNNYFASTITLPQQAKITEVEFYTIHNIAGTAYFYLSQATPSTGGEFAYSYSTLLNTSPSVVTIGVNVSTSLPNVDNTSAKYILYWLPAGVGNTEVLYGARVGYTGGLGRFGA